MNRSLEAMGSSEVDPWDNATAFFQQTDVDAYSMLFFLKENGWSVYTGPHIVRFFESAKGISIPRRLIFQTAEFLPGLSASVGYAPPPNHEAFALVGDTDLEISDVTASLITPDGSLAIVSERLSQVSGLKVIDELKLTPDGSTVRRVDFMYYLTNSS